MTKLVPRIVVSWYDAKTHLSEYGERAAAGEEIVVTNHGKERFRIVAVEEKKRRPMPGSIDFGLTPEESASVAAEFAFELLSITTEHAELAGALDWDHSDPFNRMIVAQALVEGMTLVSADAIMKSAPGVRVL